MVSYSMTTRVLQACVSIGDKIQSSQMKKVMNKFSRPLLVMIETLLQAKHTLWKQLLSPRRTYSLALLVHRVTLTSNHWSF